MNIRILLSVVLVVLFVGQLEAKRKAKKDKCHLREVEKCLTEIQKLGKGKDPTSIITTSNGLDKICKTIKLDGEQCARAYSKKCGSSLHREIIDLVLGQITTGMGNFCKADNPERLEFLKESPCIHKKVLSTDEYIKGCNNNFLAVVDQMDDNVNANADSAHARMCCGYLTWSDCTSNLVKDKCGDNALKQYENFMVGMTGTLSKMACPKDVFPLKGQECQKMKPLTGTKAKGKLGENGLTKYVTSLFSFMFITDN